MSCRLQKPSACIGCPLYSLGTGFSEPDGTGVNGVLMIGESLGTAEATEGLPFRPQAAAGGALERALRMAGLRREAFGSWNLVACQPPRNELNGAVYEQSAIDHCKVHFNRVVEQYRPKALLALGALPLRHLTGLAGKQQTLEYLRGYPLESKYDLPLIASYHPSYLARGAWNVLPVLIHDLKSAVALARNGLPEDLLKITEYGGVKELRDMRDELRDTPDMILSEDIETNYAELKDAEALMDENAPVVEPKRQEITQVNLSVRESEALVVSPLPEHMQLIKEINALPNSKVGQNIWLYDAPILEAHDAKLHGGFEDVMWRFHHIYPDLPGRAGKMKGTGDDQSEEGSVANLQFISSFYGFPFPWKHLSGERPEFYGGCDAISALRCFWGTQKDLTELGLLDGYYDLVYDLIPILENMRRRGIPVNAQMLRELHAYLQGEIKVIDGQIQEGIPKEVLPLKKPYLKRLPKDVQDVVEVSVQLAKERKNCRCFRIRKKNLEFYAASVYAVYDAESGKLRAPEPECPECKGEGSVYLPERTEKQYTWRLPFNVGSSQQMFGYANFRKHRIPRNSKREYSMDGETLEKLAASYNDPLYVLTVKERKLEKLDSTYAMGWMPESDGRVHPQVAFFPASQQLSGRKPNPQNVPSVSKNGELAVLFRKALYAEPGYTVVEGDFKSFHVQTLGFEAGDPTYIRLGKIDIHSFVAVTGLLRIEDRDKLLAMPDQELKALLKRYRKTYTLKNGDPFDRLRDGQAKPAILAFGLGVGAETVFLKNPESFTHKSEAQAVINALNEIFPKEKLYRETMPLVAKRQNHIKNAYGSIRWFFDVQHWDPLKRIYVHGSDWEAAIAYNVQASAHGYLKHAVKRLEYLGANEKYGFDNTVHDSLRFHCPTHLVEECISVVKPEMERPSTVLLMPWADNAGLSIEVEFKTGPNWGEMTEWTGMLLAA